MNFLPYCIVEIYIGHSMG